MIQESAVFKKYDLFEWNAIFKDLGKTPYE